MSLKAFHIFFVVVATLSLIGFGAWAWHHASATSTPAYGVVAVGSLIAALVLGVYGGWFLRKLRRIEFV